MGISRPPVAWRMPQLSRCARARHRVRFTLSFLDAHRSALSGARIAHCSAPYLRAYVGDRTPRRDTHLVGSRRDRHASGFHGLSSQVQTVLNEQPYSGHVFVFRAAAATSSSTSGLTAMDYACLRSAWSVAGLCGRRPIRERFPSVARSYRCCWRASIGAVRSERSRCLRPYRRT